MGDSKLTKDLNDNLRCSICVDGFKDPRMLPCVHSFCLSCLEKLASSLQRKPFSCPTCQRETTLPENGVKDLPSNFLLVNRMERLKIADTGGSASSTCQFCKGSENIQLCLDCKFHICSPCRQNVHDKIQGTDDHTMIMIDKLSDDSYMEGVLATQAPRCDEHPKEKIRFYCASCSKLVCRDCTIIGHHGHECITAEKRLEIAKQELEKALEVSEGQVKSVREIDVKLTAATKNVEKHVTAAKRKIEEKYDRLQKRLKSDREEVMQEVEKMRKKECEPFKKVKGAAKTWMDGMENVRSVAKQMIETKNQWDVLEMEKSITDALRRFNEDKKGLQEEQSQLERKDVTKFNISSTQNKDGDAGRDTSVPKRNVLGTVDCAIRVNAGKRSKVWYLRMDDRF